MKAKIEARRTPPLAAPFDPAKASKAFLAEHHLPPRPATKIAEENWSRALAGCNFVAPDTLRMTMEGALPRLRTNRSPQGPQEKSRNWSGAYVRPRRGNMVLVQGRWTMPAVPLGTIPAQTYSVWIGLDGHDPASELMPQVGVGYLGDKHEGAPRQKSFAWWQWWDGFNEEGLQTIIPELPIEEGDEIYAQVLALPPSDASFLIVNRTKSLAFHSIVPAPTLGPKNQPRPKTSVIEGRTAEWIVEQPLLPDRPDLKDVVLGNYDRATFRNCTAVCEDEDGNIEEFQLEHARTIAMNLWYDRSNPGRVASIPTIHRSQGKLEMMYVGPD